MPDDNVEFDDGVDLPDRGEYLGETLDETQVPASKQDTDPATEMLSLPSGTMVGDFLIQEVRGRGGMGVVYKALDTKLKRTVALKTLHPDNKPNELAVRRSQREAELLAQLHHPNIVPVYGLVEMDQQSYMAMLWLDGHDCAERLETSNRPFDWTMAVRIAADVARALTASHRKGIVHRDIKPANIILTEDRDGINELGVVLTDFGLAKPAIDISQLSHQQMSVFTTANVQGEAERPTISGTPSLMAPEQWNREAVDARTDIYLLGGTLYWLLTARPPFTGSPASIYQKHCNAERPNPCAINPTLPESCQKIVQRAMKIDPDERYQSAEEILQDLEELLETGGTKRTKWPWYICAALLLLLVSGLISWFVVPNGKKALQGGDNKQVVDSTSAVRAPSTASTEVAAPIDRFVESMRAKNPNYSKEGSRVTTGPDGEIIEVWMDARHIVDLSPIIAFRNIRHIRIVNWNDGLDFAPIQKLPSGIELWSDRLPPELSGINVRAILQN